VLSVSSRVKLPELPEARMETRKPMEASPKCGPAKKPTRTKKRTTLRMMAERGECVNEEERRRVENSPKKPVNERDAA